MTKRNWKFRSNEADQSDDDATQRFVIERSPNEIVPQGNKIYFYSDVNRESVLGLNRQIDELTKQMKIVQLTYNLPNPPRLEIHICSDGGDIFAGMAAVDKIINNSIPVDTYCEGIVASAATFISAVGHKRYINKSSCMLIHQVSSGLWGNYMQFKDEIKNLELLMVLIKDVYLKKTKFSDKELEELLSHDLCLNASKCLDYGLVDKIL
jgi:ATP-dependent protease ClpP protease subunit